MNSYDNDDRCFKIGDYLYNQWVGKYYKITNYLYDYNEFFYTLWDLSDERYSSKVWLHSEKVIEETNTVQKEFIIVTKREYLKGSRQKKIKSILTD